MIKKYSLTKDPILILYFITALILLLDVTDNFPLITILRKVKYPMLFIMFADALRERKFILGYKSLLVLSFFYIHTIIFGLIAINPDVQLQTATHFREMMIYLVYLTLSVEMITRKQCYVEYIEGICLAFTIFFIWTGVTHFSDFVNPLYYPMVFFRYGRIRSNFGTASPNYIGYYAFVALVFYYLLWRTWKRDNKLTKTNKYVLILIISYILCILFSTASRSSILSLLLFAGCCFLFQYKKFTKATRNIIIVIVAIVLIVFLMMNWQSIWSNSNRSENVNINMPIFEQMNAEKFGMGYIESSGFYLDAYGYDTWPVDNYYLYIYLATGVVGTVLTFIPLAIILVNYLRKERNVTQKILLAAYIALLFDGFWQVNLFTYRYIATLFINTLLLYFIGNIEEDVSNNNETIKNKEPVS